MSKITQEEIGTVEVQIQEKKELDPILVTKLLHALQAERVEKQAMYDNVTDCFLAVEAGVLHEIPNKGVIAGTHEEHENRGFVTGFLRYGHLVRRQLMKLAKTSEAPIIESVYLNIHG